ncbi:MAG TPA: SCO family protein [Gemmatimonadaceae bacterium]|nr:SCO family protein [Gemmatimonadaceae bacterium]
MQPTAIARARVSLAARATATIVAAALIAVSLTACGSGSAAERPGNEQGYRGVVLPTPLAKPNFILTDTKGQPFDFRKETDGSLTLLFFGYTNCPDVCPVHLGNIHTVLSQMPYDVSSRTKVVFVTTDPERDTPERLRSWLDNFDPSFIGLRGTVAEVNEIQAKLHLPPAVASAPHGADSSYDVGHAAQVLAFSPSDNEAHVIYPFGIRQQDWANDLPKLLSDKWK